MKFLLDPAGLVNFLSNFAAQFAWLHWAILVVGYLMTGVVYHYVTEARGKAALDVIVTGIFLSGAAAFAWPLIGFAVWAGFWLTIVLSVLMTPRLILKVWDTHRAEKKMLKHLDKDVDNG